jgi:hypothetical protein
MNSFLRSPVPVMLLLAVAGAAHGAPPCGTWNAAVMPGTEGQRLVSVSAASATEKWAVGFAVYHATGANWGLVDAPGFGEDPLGYADTTLTGVATIAPADAWIVGRTSFLSEPQTLAEHWNGSAWSVVPSPVIDGGSGFDAVTAIATDDVWAVGQRAGGLPVFEATTVTLTAHWDGEHWSAIPSPNIARRENSLLDVTAVASDDVWAVGMSRNMGEDYQTLILHWDGSAWSVTPSPNLPGENFLFGVSAYAADDVWAVGDSWDGFTARQLFLHGDGTSWSQVNGPGGPTVAAGCTGDVLAMGPNDVWAVGSDIGHWDGTDWTFVPMPEVPSTLGIVLRSLSKVGDCDAWAAGSRFDTHDVEHAISLHLTNAVAPPVDVAPTAARALALRVSPNPAFGPADITLRLPAEQQVRIEIMDPSGRLVRELVFAHLPAGERQFRWDGRDAAGRRTGAGVYFVTVTAGEQRLSAKTMRLR